MTSKSKKPRARIQTNGTLLKSTGALAAPPFKEFKLGGEICRITLTAPEVSSVENTFQINSGVIWIVNFGKDFYEDEIGNWLKKLKEPTPIRGFYCPATFEVNISNYGFEFTLEKNWNKIQNSKEPDLLITKLEFYGAFPQTTLNAPLARLKVYALQLAGLFGTAYPPNFKKYFADGKSYFQTDKDGGIDIDRYGYQITRSSALHYTQGENPQTRMLNDTILQEVARLHQTLPHGSKIEDIAQALNISNRSARFYVAQARHPQHGLIPSTGRKRSKPKKQTKGKNK